jgi:hypothetical protein
LIKINKTLVLHIDNVGVLELRRAALLFRFFSGDMNAALNGETLIACPDFLSGERSGIKPPLVVCENAVGVH